MTEQNETTKANPPLGTYPAGGATPGRETIAAPTLATGDDDVVTIIPPVEDTRPGETITPPAEGDKGDVDGVAAGDDVKPDAPADPDAPFETIVAPLPSTGRIVMYTLPTGPVRPAIVLEADGYLADLHVFTRKHDPLAGGPLQENVLYCPEPTPGTWHWPPRR